ncbi:MAG: hypothetical protein EB111_01295, partial [Actinobacteria bacterium]|nr:hypothetical protein [Actinomycetota bacterium]
MTTLQLLQRSLLPAPGFGELELYVRSSGAMLVTIDEATGDVVGVVAGTLTFDTSFGVFHAGRWRRLTSVDALTARVVASGNGRAEVVAVTRGREVVVASAPLA